MANSKGLENMDVTDGKHIHDTERGSWASKTEFILSCIGYAVGTGNVWRFPYLCYRSGGGAFLIPYLLMLFLCGIPLFFMEIVIGQFSSTGCLGMFRMCPILKGTGYAIIVVNILCVCYYSVIITYPIMFLTRIFTKTLPWMDCNNSWNTETCLNVNNVSNLSLIDLNNDHNGKILTLDYRTPADEFFHHEILRMSGGIEELGGIVWPLFGCLMFAWIFIFVSIIKGVKTVGKVVYFTAIFPFIILIILFFRGVTLPGASKGITFYVKPDWNKLWDLKVWADAAIQIFFSLGPGWGGIVNMSSYNNFRNNARMDSIFIPIVNCSTSIFAGFVVFSVLGFLSVKTGIPVAKVATGGPGLAFITYPQAIAMLPLPHLWAALFFIMLFLLGLDSIFVQIEAIISTLLDEYERLRKHKLKVTFFSCVVMFLMSTIMVTNGGMYILQLFDWYSASISVILICIMETIMVSYAYGIGKFSDDIYFMVGKYPDKSWAICIKYITPTVLVLMFFTSIIFNRNVSYNNTVYPTWAIAIGWLSCVLSISCIPTYLIYFVLRKGGSWLTTIKTYSKPFDWTPASDEHRELYQKFLREKEIEKLKMKNVANHI